MKVDSLEGAMKAIAEGAADLRAEIEARRSGELPRRIERDLSAADRLEEARAYLATLAEQAKPVAYAPNVAAVKQALTLIDRIRESHAAWGGWSGTVATCERIANLLRYGREDTETHPAPQRPSEDGLQAQSFAQAPSALVEAIRAALKKDTTNTGYIRTAYIDAILAAQEGKK